MGKYIKYKREAHIVTPKELEKIFDKLIEDGFEIINYSERILEKSENVERIALTIVCGKLNEGKEVL